MGLTATVLLVLLALLLAGCGAMAGGDDDLAADRAGERDRMVATQIEARGIADPAVLAAMRAVPRHRFVPPEDARHAYADGPLAIGHDQTISQPYVVAFMTEALGLRPGDRVLEIGTGSGYQAAVLAQIVDHVRSIEIVPELAESARAAFRACGIENVEVRTGDGYRGWPEAAPFDAIVVTAAPDHLPRPLLDQLALGGRLVLPLGGGSQQLVRIVRTAEGYEEEVLLPVRFVPMTGEALGGPMDRRGGE